MRDESDREGGKRQPVVLLLLLLLQFCFFRFRGQAGMHVSFS